MTSRPALRAAVVLLALAGCQPAADGTPGATLRVAVAGSPRPFVLQATQLGLTAFDGAGRVVPGLASSWRISNNGRSIIFRLRDAHWADGRKVTAADAVTVFRRIAAPASTNHLKPYLYGIENAAAVASGAAPPTALGIEAPIDNVVEIRLAAPVPELLAVLALPDAAIVRAGVRAGAVVPPLGPFALAAPPAAAPVAAVDASATTVELVRNPKYHAAASVGLGKIDLLTVADPGVAVARFARDRLDVVTGNGLAGLSEARLLGPQVLHVEPSWGVYGYLANVRGGPTADPRVRRALAMAIRRDDLGQRLFGVGAMTPALGLLPPGLPSAPVGALPDWAMLEPAARADVARQLLTGAGYMEGKQLTVTVTLPPGREHAAVLASVAADWATIGVRTLTRELDPTDLAAAVKRGDFELVLSERSAAVDAPAFFLAPFRCGGMAGYCNPAADAALAAPLTDPAARAAAVNTAEAAILADTPLIGLFVPVRWSLVQPRVTGWTDNAAGQHPLARLGIRPGR